MHRRFFHLTARALVLACAVAMAPVAMAQDTATAAAGESYDQQFARARELANNGQREQAIALYTAMLQQTPANTDVLLARGRTYAWMERWPEAEADLVAVTTAKPDYADAWSALGDMDLGSAIELEAITQALLMQSDDHREFYAAWSEGRKPAWSGR